MPRNSGRWCYVTMNQERFDWDAYLRETGSVAAPRDCFRQAEEPPENRFTPEMKVITIDPRNQNSWCIATVISVQGPRMRLRLDGLDNMNDTWKLTDADDIRPISWAKERPNMIVPPLGFLPRMNLWPQFLSGRLESKSAAPDDCFIPAPPSRPTGHFVVGQKLEAVDPKNPSIICVATVSQVLSDRIRVDLDGWRASYFFPVTSRDLFPVGWCERAGLMLQEPGPQAIATIKSVASSQQHVNSPDNKPPHVATALVRSRNSLQPQQTFLSPDLRKRRKSSESSANSKPSQSDQQGSETGSARKIAKTSSVGSAKKTGSKKGSVKDESEATGLDSKNEKAESVTATSDDEEDHEGSSPLGLVIDESEGEHKSEANGVRAEESKTSAKAEANSPLDEPTSSNPQPNLLSSPTSIEVDTTTSSTKNVLQVSPQNGPVANIADHSGSDIGDHLSDEKVSIFVNANCNLGPYLSNRKVAKQAKNLGPASPSAVVQDMLSLIINTATNTAEVLKLVGTAMADSKIAAVEDALKSPSSVTPSITSASEVLGSHPAIYSANDVWRLVGQITEHLHCCPNVFSNVRLTKACADCQRSVLLRRPNHAVPIGSAEAAAVASAVNAAQLSSSSSSSSHSPQVPQQPSRSATATSNSGGGLLIVPAKQQIADPASSSSSRSHLQTPWSAVPPTSSSNNSPASRVQQAPNRNSPPVDFASSYRSPHQLSEHGKPSPASAGKRPLGASSVIIKTNGGVSGAPSSTDSPPQSSIAMLSIPYLPGTSVSDWTIDEVSDYLARNPDPSLAQHADMFRKHEIDGKALLLLTSDSILKYMGLKLGPSLKLGHLIDRLRVTSSSRTAANSKIV